METKTAELLLHVQNSLGEGPVWHPHLNCLFWVDITAGDLYQSTSNLSGYSKTHFDVDLGAFCFTNKGSFILATSQGFLSWGEGFAQPELIWNPLPNRSEVRLNDGKVDPAGRFWAGSIDIQQAEGELYRLDPNGSRQVMLRQIGISNGIGWSPDQKRMYYTDSHKRTIYVYDYQLETGTISNPRVFVELAPDATDTVPDGLCVDVEGCIWSAYWNGWRVVRYSPDGKPLIHIEVPAQRVTSCCFGGEKRDLLLITTARSDLSENQLIQQPNAGDVFVFQTNTVGQPTNFFG